MAESSRPQPYQPGAVSLFSQRAGNDGVSTLDRGAGDRVGGRVGGRDRGSNGDRRR
ncbi:hypothetical protein [Micromonospora sp. NPDC005413]|uniref:hypothetical protein n=1 Tax=Micromonospora sp. NPDC005413 TaxID=3154563 RepID=UPI0033AA732A